jgi:hypothetical protein
MTTTPIMVEGSTIIDNNNVNIDNTTKILDSDDEDSMKDDYMHQIRSKRIDKLTSSNLVHVSNDSTKEYYSFDIRSSGNKFLVANMCSSEYGNFEEVFRNLTQDEVSCQILISEFTRSLSRNQQRDFGTAIDYILDFYVQQQEKAVCSLPRNIADIRRMYTDGTDSITKKLPIPNIVKLNNHSYVSLRDCVADFLFSNEQKLKMLQQYHNDSSDFTTLHHLSIFGNERVREVIQDGIDRVESQDNKSDADLSIVVILFFEGMLLTHLIVSHCYHVSFLTRCVVSYLYRCGQTTLTLIHPSSPIVKACG